ncbi:MAG: S49 family peptidase [Nocardioides sp.]
MLLIGWGISRAVSGGFKARLGSDVTIEKNTWLMIKPSDVIPDYNAEPDLGFLGGSSGSSLNDMLRALDLAKDDPNISGVVLRPMGVAGFATLRELRGALTDFKASGKPVFAHFDFGTDRDYYLMSVADSIFMMPGRLSGLQFGGMAYSNTYLKNTFSKLGIKFHVFHAGKYKGAYEELGRDSMSAELRTSIMSLYADVYDTYVRESADARKKISYDALNREVKEGQSFFVAGQECLNKGYVDALVEWAVLRKRLQAESKEFEAMSPRSYLSAKHKLRLDEECVGSRSRLRARQDLIR